MKKYLTFVIILLSIGIIGVAGTIFIRKGRINTNDRSNTQCKTSERVFDYNDVLTASEEEELEEEIAKYEDELGIDIVIFNVVDETDFSDIGLGYASNYRVGDLADELCNYYRFGYEEWGAEGPDDGGLASSSVVIVANWNTSDYTNIYMCTSGNVKKRISDSEAEEIINSSVGELRSNTLGSYEKMISGIEKKMLGNGIMTPSAAVGLGIFISIIVSLIFFCVNISKKKGKNTTTAGTYVKGGRAQVVESRDNFIRKTVTSRKISTDSGGSRGGGFSGGGGHSGSHGGGGGHF